MGTACSCSINVRFVCIGGLTDIYLLRSPPIFRCLHKTERFKGKEVFSEAFQQALYTAKEGETETMLIKSQEFENSKHLGELEQPWQELSVPGFFNGTILSNFTPSHGEKLWVPSPPRPYLHFQRVIN